MRLLAILSLIFLISCNGDSSSDLAVDQELDAMALLAEAEQEGSSEDIQNNDLDVEHELYPIKLLAEIELEGSSIQFYGSDDGEGFVSEIGTIGEEPKYTPEMENLSFTQVYAEIAPYLMVPQTIVDFDDRAAYFSEDINQARLEYDESKASISANTDLEQAEKSDKQAQFATGDHTQWFRDMFSTYTLLMHRSTGDVVSGRARVSSWAVWADTVSVQVTIRVGGRGNVIGPSIIAHNRFWSNNWVRSSRSFWTGRYYTRTHKMTVDPLFPNGRYHLASQF